MLSEIRKSERQVLHIFSHLWSRHLNLCVCAYGDQVTRMGTMGREDEIVKEGKSGGETRIDVALELKTGLD